MVLLKILTGNKAGASTAARRFPVRIGRDARAHLRLEEPGVWDSHAQISLKKSTGFVLTARPEASVSINSHPVNDSPLRNGDIITLGSVRVQFWLADPIQPSFRLREWAVWIAVGAVCVAQVWMIYALMR